MGRILSFKASVLAAAVAVSGISLSSKIACSQELKIGFIADLSASPTALAGKSGLLGIETAAEDINREGGIAGRPITIVTRNDLCQPPKSIQGISELIDSEKVIAVFGPSCSGNALAWKRIPNEKKIPAVMMIATATDITKPMSADAENYMFRIGMVDRYQAAAVVAYAKKNPGVKKIGIIVETSGFGQAGLNDLMEITSLQGLKPELVEKVGVGDSDMTSQVSKMKAAGVDAVFIWAVGTPMGMILRSMEKIDYRPIVLTNWAANEQAFSDAAGPELAQWPIFLRTTPAENTGKIEQLFERLKPKLLSPAAFHFAVQGYDAMRVFAIAANQAGSVEGTKLRLALEDSRGVYDGYLKSFSKPFSSLNHEALTPADLRWTRWRDGKLINFTDEVTSKLTPGDFKQ